jgi:alginate O-acetyltransferase complex protein AlgI
MQSLFLTYWFVFFIAAVYPLYWFVPVRWVRLGVLLAACVVFHTHFAGPAGVVPIIVLGVVTYLVGLTRVRWLCAGAITLNAGSLIYYKYTRFLCAELLVRIVPQWHALSATPGPRWLHPIAPLAISFFAFEFVHYLVEVYRGSEPIRKPHEFALFAVFWPSIVAGPVKRYGQFLESLQQGVRSVCSNDVSVGVVRVAVGLVKKFVADGLTAYLTTVRGEFEHQDLVWRWLFVAFLAARILLDFSGYSDLAIGFARMHGVRLPENFNWPYLALGLTSFWRRWHVSLSTWIRDYVYVALGGNRCGLARKAFNGLLAFALCGLWHGAGWNFLVWGLYHGVGLAVCANYRRALGPVGEALAVRLERSPVVSWGITLVYVSIGWLFFFYPLREALRMTRLLFEVI